MKLVEHLLIESESEQHVAQVKVGISLRYSGRHDCVGSALLAQSNASQSRDKDRKGPGSVRSALVEAIFVIKSYCDVRIFPTPHLKTELLRCIGLRLFVGEIEFRATL